MARRHLHRGNDTTSLNQLLFRRGLAINSAVAGQSRFGDDETDGKINRRGLWKDALSPAGISRGKKDCALSGGACRATRTVSTCNAFPQGPAMPSGCASRRYALRARVTGNIGIYHLQSCRSDPAMTKPDRWFCLEDDAKAAGFRKAHNCRPYEAAKLDCRLARFLMAVILHISLFLLRPPPALNVPLDKTGFCDKAGYGF